MHVDANVNVTLLWNIRRDMSMKYKMEYNRFKIDEIWSNFSREVSFFFFFKKQRFPIVLKLIFNN